MQKRWNVKAVAPAADVQHLAEAIHVNSIIANLLVQRGIKSYDEAKQFFRPAIESLHSPQLMKDMGKAVQRITDAHKNREKILVYGDYDVDGTTAVSVVYTFLKQLNIICDYYIPDRYKEGYGVSKQGIEYAAAHGFKLIIALDCGIKAHAQVNYAKEKGIDFIICDHHKPAQALPQATAVLNPKRDDCPYPYKELPGCAIGFKLIQALAESYNLPFSMIEPCTDIVALGIAADIVPITGENRVLAYHGLKRINNAPRPGLKAITDMAQMTKAITVNDLVFVFGPRINSAGRIESGKNAVKLLTADTPEKAMLWAGSVTKTNFERRDVDTAITQEAVAMIEQNEAMKKRKTTVLYKPDWHKGVIGIVASRLIEKHYHRPTIILTRSNGVVAGSARSVKNFDLYEALQACSNLLEQFGGHKYAAGLTIKEENLAAFTTLFEKVVSESISDELLQPEIEIDSLLHLSEINVKLYNILQQFAPFGPGNMTPVFYSENVITKSKPVVVGRNHLRMSVVQQNAPEKQFYCIGFDMGHLLPLLSEDKPFALCYSIRENVWNNEKRLDLNIRDIKV